MYPLHVQGPTGANKSANRQLLVLTAGIVCQRYKKFLVYGRHVMGAKGYVTEEV